MPDGGSALQNPYAEAVTRGRRTGSLYNISAQFDFDLAINRTCIAYSQH